MIMKEKLMNIIQDYAPSGSISNNSQFKTVVNIVKDIAEKLEIDFPEPEEIINEWIDNGFHSSLFMADLGGNAEDKTWM